MTQQTERRVLLGVALTSLVSGAAFFVLTLTVHTLDGVWEPLFLLCLGLLCQCAIRLLLTSRLNYDHDRLFVTTGGWFQKNRFDKWLIRKDPVRKWSDLAAYDPENLEVKPGMRELAIQHTCTLELVNEINAGLTFLSLLMSILADRKVLALLILLGLSILFSLWAVFTAVRARHYRFNIKAGRV